MNEIFSSFRMDKSALSVASLDAESDERAFWASKTPQERLQAVEFLRAVNYAYDGTTTRLQRLLTVVELGEC